MEKRIKVLYVDDEPGLLEIARHFLEQAGNFQVSTSTSAKDALEFSPILSYDTIISDYQMPGMHGIAFLKEVRHRYGDIPFILFTGRGREEIVIEAINNGADFYIQKGGDPEAQFTELAHKIRQAVARKRAELSRMKAEFALQGSEERLRHIIRQAPAALAMFDREMRYLVASRRWMADYHLGDKDILGCSHYEIFPEITEELKAVHRRGLSGEVVSADEEKFERQDGSVQWLTWEVRPWYTTGNVIGGIIIFSEDVTERKKAEEALRQKTEELDQFFTASLDLFCIAGTDGYFRRLNPEWERALGYTLAEMEGHRFLDFVHPDDQPGTLAAITDLAGQKQVLNFTNRFRHKDGTYRWIEWRSYPSGDRIFAAARDITERKHAEDALQESRAELSSILHGLPVLQFVIGRDHRILSWNKALEAYSGIRAADVIGTDQQWRAFYPHQRPVVADLLLDNNTDGLSTWYAGKLRQSRYVEGAYEATDFFPAMGASGTWLSFTAAPIRNAEGAIIGAVETLEDVTERVNATEALKASEEKYRQLYHSIMDAIACMEMDGRITFFNETFAKMVGYHPEEISALTYRDLTPEKWIAPENEIIEKQVLKRGYSDIYEKEYRRKDGRIFPVELRTFLIRDTSGNPKSIWAIIRDITERRQAEAARHESEIRLRRFYESGLFGVIFWNIDGTITDANDKFLSILGYTREDLKAGLINGFRITPPEFAPVDEQSIAELRATGVNRVPLEKEYLRKDGTRVPVILAGAMLDEQRSEGVGFVLDITDRKMAEETLRQANRKLNLLSGITRHDIKNQLMALSGFLEISRNSLEDPVRTAAFIEKEMKIAEIISNQISFTRDYENLGVKSPVWQNVSVLVRKIITGLSLGDVRVDVVDPSLEIFVDPLCEKVFYNLIDNALRYGGEKMTAIRIFSQKTGEDLVIVVEDNGAGIAADDKERLFERGFGKNTGLGLFLSREILSITGITITETGEPGKGARFEMTVPKGEWRD